MATSTYQGRAPIGMRLAMRRFGAATAGCLRCTTALVMRPTGAMLTLSPGWSASVDVATVCAAYEAVYADAVSRTTSATGLAAR